MLSDTTRAVVLEMLNSMRIIGTSHMDTFDADAYRARIDAAIAEVNAEAEWVPVEGLTYSLERQCYMANGKPKYINLLKTNKFRLFQRIGSQSEAQDDKP